MGVAMRTSDTTAFLLAYVVGALSATLVGYAIHEIGAGIGGGGMPFTIWLTHPGGLGWWPWPILGGLISSLSHALRRLGRT